MVKYVSCSDGCALEFDSRAANFYPHCDQAPPRCLVFIRTPLIYRDQARRPKTSIFICFSSGISPKLAKFYPHREEASGRIFRGPVHPTQFLAFDRQHLFDRDETFDGPYAGSALAIWVWIHQPHVETSKNIYIIFSPFPHISLSSTSQCLRL